MRTLVCSSRQCYSCPLSHLDACLRVPVGEAVKHKHVVQAVEVADSRLSVEEEGALIHLIVGRA